MPKQKITDSAVFPVNYSALESSSWFIADTQIVQNLAIGLFRGGMSSDDPNLIPLLVAIDKSIAETLDDISQIQAFLTPYRDVGESINGGNREI